MTRRAFVALVACLPLSWQVTLGAAPPPPPALTMAVVTATKIAIFEPHRIWMGEIASPRYLPAMLHEYARLAGHDGDALERTYLPGLIRDLERHTGHVIEYALHFPGEGIPS